MRLESECAPDVRRRRLRQAGFARHGACAPMRRRFGNALQRLGDHGVDPCIVNRSLCARPRGVNQSVQPMLDESGAPLRNRLLRHALATRNHLVVHAFGAGQNNASPQRQRLCGLAPQRQRRELLAFGFAQHQFCLRFSSHGRLVVCIRYTIDSARFDQFNELITHGTSDHHRLAPRQLDGSSTRRRRPRNRTGQVPLKSRSERAVPREV